jgi:hypothetical protein
VQTNKKKGASDDVHKKYRTNHAPKNIKLTPGFNRGNSANKQKKGASGDVYKSAEPTMRRNWKLY